MSLKTEETERYTLHEHLIEGRGEVINARQMMPGQFAVIIDEDFSYYKGHLIARFWEHLISFSDRSHDCTWDAGERGPDFKVRLLPPTSAITLVVK